MRVNIEEQLLKQRNKRNKANDILLQVQQVLADDVLNENAIRKVLANEKYQVGHNAFNLNFLETNKIFHIQDIKTICVVYRLRFLDSHLFKGEMPNEAINKIKQLEKVHKCTLGDFKIMAPSKLFRLENYDDPLLFAPMGNGYYYLIHKWGNDLSVWRKWFMYPFRNLDTLIITTVLAAFLLALSFPKSYFHPEYKTTQFIYLCFFWFKVIGFCLVFFGVSRGKNFNSAIWNSRFSNR